MVMDGFFMMLLVLSLFCRSRGHDRQHSKLGSFPKGGSTHDQVFATKNAHRFDRSWIYTFELGSSNESIHLFPRLAYIANHFCSLGRLLRRCGRRKSWKFC